MDFLDQVEHIRQDIIKLSKVNVGAEVFYYPLKDFTGINKKTGQEEIIISKNQHLEILRYLHKIGFSYYLEESSEVQPLLVQEPPISLNTLELISKELGKIYSSDQIINFLKEAEVDERLIISSKIKWHTFYRVFKELDLSRPCFHLLLKVISESIHPLNLGGDFDKSYELKGKFASWLECDYFEISDTNTEGDYRIFYRSDEDDDEFSCAEADARFDKIKLLKQPKNKVKLALLRELFQALINTVKLFCDNKLVVTPKLNYSYKKFNGAIWGIVHELNLKSLIVFTTPFNDLLLAEEKYLSQKRELSWDSIRPKMYKVLENVEWLCDQVNDDDITVPWEKFDELKKEIDKLNTQVNPFDEQSCFQFAEMSFKLRTSDGGVATLNFSKGDSYRLFWAIIAILRHSCFREGSWLVADIKREDLKNKIIGHFGIKKDNWSEWIKDTKHNLKTKMDNQDSFSDYFQISDYQEKIGGYTAKIKLPA